MFWKSAKLNILTLMSRSLQLVGCLQAKLEMDTWHPSSIFLHCIEQSHVSLWLIPACALQRQTYTWQRYSTGLDQTSQTFKSPSSWGYASKCIQLQLLSDSPCRRHSNTVIGCCLSTALIAHRGQLGFSRWKTCDVCLIGSHQNISCISACTSMSSTPSQSCPSKQSSLVMQSKRRPRLRRCNRHWVKQSMQLRLRQTHKIQQCSSGFRYGWTLLPSLVSTIWQLSSLLVQSLVTSSMVLEEFGIEQQIISHI